MPRKITLRPEQRKELIRHIEDERAQAVADLQTWFDGQIGWYQQWRSILPNKVDPWPGCSNLSLPVTKLAVQQTHAALLKLVSSEKTFVGKPTESGDIQAAKHIGDLANWMAVHELDLQNRCDAIFLSTTLYGLTPTLTRWCYENEYVHEPVRVSRSEVEGAPNLLVALARYQFDEALRSHTIRTDGQGRQYLVAEVVEDGSLRDAELHIVEDEDRFAPRDDEIEFEVVMERVTSNHPVIDIPDTGDVVWTTDGQRPEDASMAFYSLWYTFRDVAARRRRGEWEIRPKLWKELKVRYKTGGLGDEGQLAQGGRAKLDAMGGIQSQSARRRHRMHVLKVFLDWDLDGDDVPERLIVTALTEGNTVMEILRVEYLEQPFPMQGRRPICYHPFLWLPSVAYAMGVPEYAKYIQAEIDAIHNARVDRDTVINTPWYHYVPGAQLIESTVALRPGQGIPIGNPQGVRYPAFPQSTASDMMTEQHLIGMAERMFPINDVQMGRHPGGRQTATGMAILESRGAEAGIVYLQRTAGYVRDVGKNALLLTAAFGPRQKAFRILGKNDLVVMDRKGLAKGWDIDIIVSALAQEAAIKAQKGFMHYQGLIANPAIATNPLRLYAVSKHWLEGDGLLQAEIEALLGPEPSELTVQPVSPEQEILYFLQGTYRDPHPQDNHEAHLMAHQQQLLHPAMAAGTHPVARKLLLAHLEATERMASMIQRQAMAAQAGAQQGAGGDVREMFGAAAGAPGVAQGAALQDATAQMGGYGG